MHVCTMQCIQRMGILNILQLSSLHVIHMMRNIQIMHQQSLVVYMYACMRAGMRAFIHTFVCTYIHMYINVEDIPAWQKESWLSRFFSSERRPSCNSIYCIFRIVCGQRH